MRVTISVAMISAVVLAGLSVAPSASFATTRLVGRLLFAVNQAGANRGSISIYDIDTGHKLVNTITTVPNVKLTCGAVANAAKGKMYVSYRNTSGAGHVFAFDVKTEKVLWDHAYSPNVDRLAISPDGSTLYVPSGENINSSVYNVVNSVDGSVERTVRMPTNHLHDMDFPLPGQLFLITHAPDASGKYMYEINTQLNFGVRSFGPLFGETGPFAVDSKSHYSVNQSFGLWGFQVVDLRTNQIRTVPYPNPPLTKTGFLHGIGWKPNQTEVWSNTDTNIEYVWDMTNPMAPKLKKKVSLPGTYDRHWVDFDIRGDYAYISPARGTANPTAVINTSNYQLETQISSTEETIEVDFNTNGNITEVGEQYGIGRAP
jgi:WD40 repeat protein